MRLSRLQKHILLRCYESKNVKVPKSAFYKYYPAKEFKENKLGVQVGVQSSLENLVVKDLVVVFGYKTAKKLYINKVRLTAKGRKIARELIKKRQRKLPIK
ncbi:unnamed protein product [marine sediment metagenome]|uniref:Winged helix DNA-binding domain-containing protein n=1 Tax=marine sediment metagenome TaxID=412755 RepID=X0UTE2_9ZZZZ